MKLMKKRSLKQSVSSEKSGELLACSKVHLDVSCNGLVPMIPIQEDHVQEVGSATATKTTHGPQQFPQRNSET